MKLIITLILFINTIVLFGQNNNNESNLKEQHTRDILRKSLSDSTQHNVIGKEIIIKNKKNAIKIAEQILFDVYGEHNIKCQRPYDAYNIDNYWVISGTLEKGHVGGTFLIIIDAHDSRVIRISHGK